MSSDPSRVRKLLKEGDFRALFVDELGWDRYDARVTVQLEGQSWTLQACAQKRGMVAYLCPVPDGARVPDYAARRKIERHVAKAVHEHLIVFTDSTNTTQVWQWVRRESGKPTACREHTFQSNQTGEALAQKLRAIAFSLDEEESLTLTDVTRRARRGFDVEHVTKRFYDQFRKEHGAFLKFITGITESADQDWYASVMLNRLMFVYFIQRKGFLDSDSNYLRNRLNRCQQQRGDDKFYSFYRYFLLRLFQEGLGGKTRTAELDQLLGRIPYLNGGLFERHEVEARHSNIQIPDKAFERIFDYFDQYQWHLDERPLRADNEINPDVLGYIFEKYINQKQMGAYYTKDDITEYISKNTVLPRIFDAARTQCKVAFENPKGPTVWDLLQADPGRYLYPAVRHGADRPLPAEIAAGVNPPTLHQPVGDGPVGTLELRRGWNKPAPGEHALPTETWREVVARRTRYKDFRAKLEAGDVRDINDIVTLNLDIRQFAQDAIEHCEGPELLRAFWQAIEKVTILDPTCGSGAFLFAALNILEPLYEACLARMEAFVEDLDRFDEEHRPEKFSDFRKVLERVAAHPNRRYFIFKSIILNNLFGVDIMEEAVEICKLRLFLKLAAQVEPDPAQDNLGIEPLPDIDFNIKAGNTLVGFATYDDAKRTLRSTLNIDNVMERISVKAAGLQQAFDAFRERQVESDGSMPNGYKMELQGSLSDLRDELDRYLYAVEGVEPTKKDVYSKWLKSHQPFHWFVEFYGIMSRGGFDVVIGNPPYVEYSKVRTIYTVPPTYATLPCGNLYSLMLERSYSLTRRGGWLSLIVPLSLVCTSRTVEARQLVEKSPAWISTYDIRPATLFEGVSQRLSILVAQNRSNDEGRLLIGGYRRWTTEERPLLIQQTTYVALDIPDAGAPFPKLSVPVETGILAKIAGIPLAQFSNKTSATIVVHRIVRYFVKALDFVPVFHDFQSKKARSEDYKDFAFDTDEVEPITALLNSTLFYWFWRAHCDGFHCGYNDVYSMPYKRVTDPRWRLALKKRLWELMQHLKETSAEKTITTRAGQIRYQEFYPAQSKLSILDEIDLVLARHYGFTEEELDFIVNYDIKYRMGRDSEGEDE